MICGYIYEILVLLFIKGVINIASINRARPCKSRHKGRAPIDRLKSIEQACFGINYIECDVQNL